MSRPRSAAACGTGPQSLLSLRLDGRNKTVLLVSGDSQFLLETCSETAGLQSYFVLRVTVVVCRYVTRSCNPTEQAYHSVPRLFTAAAYVVHYVEQLNKVHPDLTPVYIIVGVPSVSSTVVPDQQPEASEPPLVGLMAMGSCFQ